MITVKYVGSHQSPHTKEVDVDKAKELLSRGDYVLISEGGMITDIKKPKEEKEDKGFTTIKKKKKEEVE